MSKRLCICMMCIIPCAPHCPPHLWQLSYTIAEVITERRHQLNWDQVGAGFDLLLFFSRVLADQQC